MAIKSSDQITIIDVSDGYSVDLSLDSVALNGSTSTLGTQQTVIVNVTAKRGSEAITPVVGTPTCPSNVTASVGSASGNAVPVTLTFASALNASGKVTIPVTCDSDVEFVKDFSFAIAFKGSTGTAATNVLIGNESAIIYCDKDGNVEGAQTITIPFAGYLGASRKACTLATPTLPTGMSIPNNGNVAATTSADGSLTINVANDSALGGSMTGEITLSFSCNSQTFVKKFSWAKAITGATGIQGPQGNPGVSATSVVCGNDAVTIACDKDGKAKAASSIVIPFAGYIGTARAACTVTYSTLPSGVSLATNGNVAATTSADGSLTLSVASGANFGANATMTGDITLTFSCNSQTFVRKFTWSKSLTGATGSTGPKGDDAITLVITSSNGIIFKNASIATTLTAHVYQGGIELGSSAVTALGTLKWYKDGGSTAVETGATLTISAGDVDSKATYECRLEA